MKRIYVVTVMMTVGLMLTSCGNTDAQQNSQAVVSDTESQQASDETVENAEQIESDVETGDEEQVPNAEKDAQDNVSDEAASDEVEQKNADENYQFKLSDFKYNIPDDYDVRFVFGETYGNSIKPNEFELTYDDLDFQLDINLGSSQWYSVYAGRNIDFSDFIETDTIIDTDEYGSLKVYLLSESSTLNFSKEEITRQNELTEISLDSGKVYLRAVYKSDQYERVLEHLIPLMIAKTDMPSDVQMFVLEDEHIEVDADAYDYAMAPFGADAFFALNVPDSWDVLVNGYGDKNCESITLDPAKVTGTSAGIAFGVGWYKELFAHGNNFVGEEADYYYRNVDSLTLDETVSTPFGTVYVFSYIEERAMFNSVAEDFCIYVNEEQFGILKNNDDIVIFWPGSNTELSVPELLDSLF